MEKHLIHLHTRASNRTTNLLLGMMGSGQSSGDRSGRFSIDPSGKISQSKTKGQQRDRGDDFTYGNDNQPAAGDHETGSNIAAADNSERAPEQQTSRIVISQLSTLDNMPTDRGDSSDQLRLQEIDEILTRMKTKYKPNSAEMAGKHLSPIKEIEKNLIHCYKTNKEQPLKCAKLCQEYKDCVDKQRAQYLALQLRTKIANQN